MADIRVYALNSRLGIFREDDSELLDDEISKCERHLGDDAYPPPELDYLNDISSENDVPSGDDVEIQTYLDNHVQSAGVPQMLSDNLLYLGEYNSGEIVVNKLGYIPLVRRIQDLQRAGEVLRAYRESVYDGHDIGDDDLPLNPFNAPNADFVDIDRAVKKAEETIKNAKAKYGKSVSKGLAAEALEGEVQQENSDDGLSDLASKEAKDGGL